MCWTLGQLDGLPRMDNPRPRKVPKQKSPRPGEWGRFARSAKGIWVSGSLGVWVRALWHWRSTLEGQGQPSEVRYAAVAATATALQLRSIEGVLVGGRQRSEGAARHGV